MEYEAYRKSSETGLRRTAPAKEGQRGYHPSWKEKRENKQPREVTAVQSGDSLVTMGVNRKKEVTIAVSEEREKDLREDRAEVNMDRAAKVRGRSGEIYTNSHDPRRSAVAVKERLSRQTAGLERRLWDMARRTAGNEVIEEAVPFLVQQREMKPGTPDFLHQKQMQRKLRQEIAASMEQLKKKAAGAEEKHGSFTRRPAQALLTGEDKADGGQDGEEKPDPEKENKKMLLLLRDC